MTDAAGCGCEQEPHTCESDEDRELAALGEELDDLRTRLTAAILETNTVRQEAARAEAERDRLSRELEELRVELVFAQRAREKAERDVSDIARELDDLRATVQDAFQ